MIKEAKLYENELQKLYVNIWNDPKYKYYISWFGTQNLEIPNNTYGSRNFAIIDNDDIIGYIAYDFKILRNISYATNFRIISFKQNLVFGFDLIKIIDDIFCKYNLDKIEFHCCKNNPISKHYIKFINRYGGRYWTGFTNTYMLIDGELTDNLCFELYKEDYLKNKRRKKYESN